MKPRGLFPAGVPRRVRPGILIFLGVAWALVSEGAVFQDGDWVGREVTAAWYEVRRVEAVDVTLKIMEPPGADVFVEYLEANDPRQRWRPLVVAPAAGGLVRDLGAPEGRFYRLVGAGGVSAPPSRSASPVELSIHVDPLTRVERTESVVLAPGFEKWHVRVDILEPAAGPPGWRTLSQVAPGPGRLPFRFENLSPVARFRLLARPAFDREIYEVILVGGQSNALLPPLTDRASAPGVWQGDDRGQWAAAGGDPGDVTGAYRYAFATEAAIQLRPRVGRDFLLVPTAVGGSSMRLWTPAADRYDARTLYGGANWLRLLWAARGPRAIWYFGHESSMQTDDELTVYATDWASLIEEWRRDAGHVPLIYAQVGRSTEDGISARLRLGAEVQRRLESGQPGGLSNQHMVVSFDLPLADYIHLSAEGQRLLGRRFALAMRQHVYGEAVDGTGPRLVGLIQTEEADLVRIEFCQAIQPAQRNYDGLFRAYAGGEEIEVLGAQRGSVPTEVLVRVADPQGRPLEISYGDRAAGGFHQRLHDVVRNATDLPAPSFGRRPVGGNSSSASSR